MDAFNFVNQEQAADMPTSDEEIIKLLGLSDNAGNNNAGMAVNDLVRDLDLDIFTAQSTVVATSAPMGYELIQGHRNQQHQQFVAHQPAEIISYVDLESSETETTQYLLSGGFMISHETIVQPTLPQEQEVSSPAPPSTVEDHRQPAGGKAQGRRREPKVKLYQRKETLASPEDEKRRQNAINAKMNRDKKKNEKQELQNLVESLTAERNALQTENTQLKTKSELFESQLKAVCKQFNVPVIILRQ